MTEIDVVAAVIERDGLVLCALRGGTGPLAGLWEFPGGKVEPGEEPTAALRREIAEELDCEIEVGAHVVTATHAYDFAAIRLSAYRCRLVSGTPVLTDHTELRWLLPAELPTLAWAPADLPAVERLAETSARQ